MSTFKKTYRGEDLDFLEGSSLDTDKSSSDDYDDGEEQLFTKKHKFKKFPNQPSKDGDKSNVSSKHSTPRKFHEEGQFSEKPSMSKAAGDRKMSQSSTRDMDDLENQGKENKLKMLRKMKRETSVDSEKSEEHSSLSVRNKIDAKNEFSISRKSSSSDIKVHSREISTKPQTEMDLMENPLSSRRTSIRKPSIETDGSYKKEKRNSYNGALYRTSKTKDDGSTKSLKSSDKTKTPSIASDLSTRSSNRSSRVDCDKEIENKKIKENKEIKESPKHLEMTRSRKSSNESRNSSSSGEGSRRLSASSSKNSARSRSSSVQSRKSNDSERKEGEKEIEKVAKPKKGSVDKVKDLPRKSILKQTDSNFKKKNISESFNGPRGSDRSSSKVSSRDSSSDSDTSVCRSFLREPGSRSTSRTEEVKKTRSKLLDDVIGDVKVAQEGQPVAMAAVYKMRSASKLKPLSSQYKLASVLKEVKPRYLGEPPNLEDLSSATSTDAIRYLVFKEWSKAATQRLKKMKVEEKQKREQELKLKKEKEDKLEESKVNFEAWKRSKKGWIEEKKKKKREEEEKIKKEKEELMQKKREGEQTFTKWKESKESVLKEIIRKKVKEKMKTESAEKNKGREKEEEAKKLFEAWKKKKDSLLAKSSQGTKLKTMKEEETKRREKENRERKAMESYLEWCERKLQQEKEEEYKTKLRRYSSYDTGKKPWRPSSSCRRPP